MKKKLMEIYFNEESGEINMDLVSEKISEVEKIIILNVADTLANLIDEGDN